MTDRFVVLVMLSALVACTPNRPPPAPEAVLPWGAVNLKSEEPRVNVGVETFVYETFDPRLVERLPLNDAGVR
ncbi:MAG: hypothetical protein ACFB3T_15690 [Geminicoccaceae bacterium]